MNKTTQNVAQDWKPALYNQAVDVVYSDDYTKPLFDLLCAQPNERIVDLGCGTGELTLRLQRLVGKEGIVVGVDASENMLAKAKENGLVNYFLGDIQKLEVPDKFKPLVGTFDGNGLYQRYAPLVQTAKILLKPGGRFVGEFCGYMNAVGLRSVTAHILERRGRKLSEPCFLPHSAEYASLLESEGFVVEHISLNPRVINFPGSLVDFLRAIFRISYLKDLEDEEAGEVIQAISRICEFDHKDGAGAWTGMYVTIRFRAIAPE
ncbi:methyltransferase domain protein [Rhizoctonia solani]|uniref:Methyltransferase domain protein n=1 Tax=Rhizoctonia solani TaxID=456999 RepID=A0A8H8NVU7_9AGAM|nr:methyltransferase domain protein [Rhizoctonia solani]QRW20315.1 methyltransferase domain protein [Rhizoctonia solani]